MIGIQTALNQLFENMWKGKYTFFVFSPFSLQEINVSLNPFLESIYEEILIHYLYMLVDKRGTGADWR